MNICKYFEVVKNVDLKRQKKKKTAQVKLPFTIRLKTRLSSTPNPTTGSGHPTADPFVLPTALPFPPDSLDFNDTESLSSLASLILWRASYTRLFFFLFRFSSLQSYRNPEAHDHGFTSSKHLKNGNNKSN